MSFDFVNAAEEFEEYLKETLPMEWRIQPSDVALPATQSVVLAYAQTDIAPSIAGKDLPRGAFGIDFEVVLSTPEKDFKKGFPHLMRELPILFKSLDANPSLTWTSASRGVTQAGESVYTLSVTLIATYKPEDN